LPPDQRIPDLTRRVRPALVAVGVVDVDDPSMQGSGADGRSGAFDFW
jgi:hypothetical protein